jgi:cobalt-zinc-cadmium efflux system membrane fusion protein
MVTICRTKISRAVSAIATSCAVLASSACSQDAAARDRSSLQVRVTEVSDSSLFTIQRADRFPVVSVDSRLVADHLSGTCVVNPDVNRTVPVNALGGGRVLELKVRLGDHVLKGQPLVTISSPDLSAALSDHFKAVADAALAKRQLDRSRVLFEHGSIAQKDLEAAEDANQKAEVDLRTTLERVRMLGGDATQTSPLIELKAPIEGTIIEQNITPAAGVKSPDNAPNLFTIADLSRVWVLCDVYENDLSRARVGQVARVRLKSYPDRSFAGQIGNISQVLDPNTRTAKVRVEMSNRGGLLRPGMFAVAELESATPRDHVVLPTSAIVLIHDAAWVFLKVGPNAFRRVQVVSGREVEPGVQEILGGLTPGQAVVQNALQFIQTVEQE